MIDIVEDAIARREALEDGNRADTNEFAEPRVCLVGYGDRGVKLAEQGWDDRYPDPKYPEATAHCVEGIGALPRSVTTADHVILVGHATDHELAVSIGDALSDETTSVAVSVPAANEPTRHVGPVDTTIPCGPDDVQELITDVLTVLTARIEISPPPQIYDELRAVGRLDGFRGQRCRDDSTAPPRDFAERLVSDALASPIAPGSDVGTEHVFSLLSADETVTLETADAVRDALSARLNARTEPILFAVDATVDGRAGYRLSVLCT